MMKFDKYVDLSKQLKSKYWDDFKSGHAWNYFIIRQKFNDNDSWSTKEEWGNVAKECIDNNKNVLQALEVLLILEYDDYFSIADEVVNKWYKEGGHDDYYYFDIIATFPEEHKIRKKLLNPSIFKRLMSCDGWGQNSIARQALLRVGDIEFKEYLGEWLNKSIESGIDDENIENNIIPLLVEFGEIANDYVSINNLNYIKEFAHSYLNKDQMVVEQLLNSRVLNESQRSIWIADNIAYWSWMLGWQDILESLKSKEWYWAVLFSDFWEDADNNNLVVWSLCHDNVIIKNRAIEIMQKGDINSIDGVIALERYCAK